MTETSSQQTLRSRYSELETDRNVYLTRARSAAEVTIPSLFPPNGASGSTQYPTPYQALGSRGLKNLASKLLLALLPPNASFFRMMIASAELQAISAENDARTKIEEAFAGYEREVNQNIEGSNIRTTAFESIKQLLVSGNVCLYLPDDKDMKYYRLDRYVVKRDPMGEVYEGIIKETLDKRTLPEELKSAVGLDDKTSNDSSDKSIDVYTKVYREEGMWKVYQEVNDVMVPGSEGSYPLDESPWIFLRFTAVSGEDYGRGFVEEHIGDLISYEKLSKAMVQGAAAAAKILYMVNPNGVTRAKDLTNKESGSVIQGTATDVTMLQLDKAADFRIAFEQAKTLEERLGFAFMLNTAIQRSGERVTAEEIRYMAGELEDALGGVYSILTREFQLPLVKRVIGRMTQNSELPELPPGIVKPVITTGLEALGRGHDLNKLNVFMANIQPLGPDALKDYLNVGSYITQVASATNVDTKGLIYTPEEVQQRKQQDLMMQAAMAAAPQVAGNLTPNVELPQQQVPQ